MIEGGHALSALARTRGLLLGGALGDAIGAAFEGSSGRATLDDVPATAWAWTDDTELTYATGLAIVEQGRVSPEHIAAALAARYRQGIRGLGSTTAGALRALATGGHWALCGIGGERAAGNGAAMRVAPLGLFLDPSDLDDRRIIRDVARITHHHDEAYAAALAVVAAVATPGLDRPQSWLDSVAATLSDSRTRDTLRKLDVRWSLPDCAAVTGTSGYAPESVPLALFAALNAQRNGFAQTLQTLIDIGGDVDTIASIAGQVFGAAAGDTALPVAWISELPGAVVLGDVAARLAELMCAQ